MVADTVFADVDFVEAPVVSRCFGVIGVDQVVEGQIRRRDQPDNFVLDNHRDGNCEGVRSLVLASVKILERPLRSIVLGHSDIDVVQYKEDKGWVGLKVVQY